MTTRITLLFASLTLLVSSMKAQYVIYPTPQNMKQTSEQTVPVPAKVNVVMENGIDTFTKSRLEEVLSAHQISVAYVKKPVKGAFNVMLGINKSGGVVDKLVAKMGAPRRVFDKTDKFDRHIIGVHPGGLYIIGENTDAVFFGLATLEQMLEQTPKTLKSVLFEDYSDMQYRGIVEGYYGYPYSVESKKELMRFFKRYKMNTYLYGAKSDPYHSGFWRDPYPTTITATQEKNGWLSQSMITDLAKLSLETKVNFIWAIHPNSGKPVSFSTDEATDQATADVLAKFDLMYKLGVRQFAVFLDDAGWDMNDVDRYARFLTDTQHGLEQRYNQPTAQPADTVKPIHYVPHIYAIDFASKADRDVYFKALQATPENIVIYTTGASVWAHPCQSDFRIMEEHMGGRKVAFWWNYPCNDNKDGRIYTASMYDNLAEMGLKTPEKDISANLGIVSNPMQQGQVAKIGLFGVADYSWNTAAFDNTKNWEAAFLPAVGEKFAKTYRYLSDYLRYGTNKGQNDWVNSSIKAPKSFEAKMDSIIAACRVMEGLEHGTHAQQLLYVELKPWLAKLSKMCQMAKDVQASIKETNGNPVARWENYLKYKRELAIFETDKAYQVDALEGMGENPPSEWHSVEPSMLLFQHLNAWINSLCALNNSSEPDSRSLISLSSSTPNSLRFASSSDNRYWLESDAPLAGEVFLTFDRPYKLSDVKIAPNTLKAYTIEASTNGRKWQTVRTAETLSRMGFVKYLKFKKNPKSRLAIPFNKDALSFVVPGPARHAETFTKCAGQPWQGHGPELYADGDYSTFCTYNTGQKEGDYYGYELQQPTTIHNVRLAIDKEHGDFMARGVVEISLDGKTWTPLKLRDSDVVEFSVEDGSAIAENKTCMGFVFDGEEKQAKFVRFRNVKPLPRWFRLYEIQVNALLTASQALPRIEDAAHNVLDALSDGLPTTSATLSNTYIVYRPTSMNQLKSLSFYADIDQMPDATIKVSVDGENWIDKGRLEKGLTIVDLTDSKDVMMVVVEFGSTVTRLYDVVENY